MADRVLVTGGTGSIGQAIVKILQDGGADVTFTYWRNQKRARELEEATGAHGVKWTAGDTTPAVTGLVDVLVNNAAINISRVNVADIESSIWNNTIQVNLWGAVSLAQACLPTMVGRGRGKIVNINSIYGVRGCEQNLPYSASKHALSALTKTIALEYGRKGVICAEICPGPVASELLTRIASEQCDGDALKIEEYLAEAAEEMPTGELVQPEEIAEAVKWMVEQKGKALNGATIIMDGGLTL